MIASIYRYPDSVIGNEKKIVIEYDKAIHTQTYKHETEIVFMKNDIPIHSVVFNGNEPFRIYFMSENGHTFDTKEWQMNGVIN